MLSKNPSGIKHNAALEAISGSDIMKAVGWKSSKVALGYVKTDSKKVKQMIDNLPE